MLDGGRNKVMIRGCLTQVGKCVPYSARLYAAVSVSDQIGRRDARFTFPDIWAQFTADQLRKMIRYALSHKYLWGYHSILIIRLLLCITV